MDSDHQRVQKMRSDLCRLRAMVNTFMEGKLRGATEEELTEVRGNAYALLQAFNHNAASIGMYGNCVDLQGNIDRLQRAMVDRQLIPVKRALKATDQYITARIWNTHCVMKLLMDPLVLRSHPNVVNRIQWAIQQHMGSRIDAGGDIDTEHIGRQYLAYLVALQKEVCMP